MFHNLTCSFQRLRYLYYVMFWSHPCLFRQQRAIP